MGNEDFSDHFPLKCTLTIGHEVSRTYQYDHIENLNSWQKFKWREELKNEFLTKFRDIFTNLKCKIDQSSESAVQYLSELIGIYRKAGESMKVKAFNKKGDNYSQSEWWDNECQLLKSNKYSLLRKFRFTNRNIDLITYKKVKKSV